MYESPLSLTHTLTHSHTHTLTHSHTHTLTHSHHPFPRQSRRFGSSNHNNGAAIESCSAYAPMICNRVRTRPITRRTIAKQIELTLEYQQPQLRHLSRIPQYHKATNCTGKVKCYSQALEWIQSSHASTSKSWRGRSTTCSPVL